MRKKGQRTVNYPNIDSTKEELNSEDKLRDNENLHKYTMRDLCKLCSLKYLSLVVLVLQTTSLVLLMRHSRTTTGEDGEVYISSTVIFFTESLKLIVSLIILLILEGSFSALLKILREEIIAKPGETFKLLIPSALYTIQNNLLFLALTYLDAATYQVTYQLKILTTAIFSVLMLKKRLRAIQWMSLVLLMCGVALVQWPNKHSVADTDPGNKDATNLGPDKDLEIIGLLAVLVSCFSSGFSGVYFEKLVKFSSQSLWVRNVQMAMFGVILALLAVIAKDLNVVIEHGFFYGYDSVVLTIISLHTFGGLVVALVMKYADNILKGFATSISIVLSSTLSYHFQDFTPSSTFCFGATTVIAATLLYAA